MKGIYGMMMAAAVAVAMTAGASQAALVGLDFQKDTSAHETPNWNNHTNSGIPSTFIPGGMVDVDGNPVDYSLKFLGVEDPEDFDLDGNNGVAKGNPTIDPASFDDPPFSAAGGQIWMRDYNVDSPMIFMTFQWDGLDDNFVYDLQMLSTMSDGGYERGDVLFTITDTGVSKGVMPTDNTEWVTFNNVAPTDGAITFTVSPSEWNPDADGTPVAWAYFNAATIEEVPEPASLALLGLGGLTLIRRRRSA